MKDIRRQLVATFPELKHFITLMGERDIRFYIVGGALRDLLIGVQPKDIDFVPDREAEAGVMAKLFADRIGGVMVEFHSHGDVYRVIHNGRSFDFTELQGRNIDEDLRRRDFTINSLALCVMNASDMSKPITLLDPMNGLGDIDAKLVKINNDKVYDDDPLRIMRLFRFAYRFGFRVDDFSYRLIPQKLFGLDRVSGERIREELAELLRFNGAAKALEAMEGVGILSRLFPLIAGMKGFPQNDYHHLDVFSHTIEAISALENPDLLTDPRIAPYADRIQERFFWEFPSGHSRMSLVKLAMLFHDIGKPGTASYDDNGRLHFIGHEKLSVSMVKDYLVNLRMSRRETHYILMLIDGHMRPGQINLDSPNVHKQVYRYFKEFGPEGVELAMFSLADRLAARGPAVSEEMIDWEYDICAKLLDTFFNRSQLIARPPKLLSGRDLIEKLGVEPGPRVGILLDRIEEAQIEGSVKDTEGALAYASQLIESFEANANNSPSTSDELS